MRFDIHLRAAVREQIEQLAQRMKSWEDKPRLDDAERDRLRSAIVPFEHTTVQNSLIIAGVDGSGDYPALTYSDSFVYATVAHGTIYEADRLSGLREVGPSPELVFDFTWVPEGEDARQDALDAAFTNLGGRSVFEVIHSSDYRQIKAIESRKPNTTEDLVEQLIRPHAADAGNIGIQLRSTGELGAALRLIEGEVRPAYVLIDGTLSLPFVDRASDSLFYEHLKRLCCVKARERGISFLALSKSHGLPQVELVEDLAREKMGLQKNQAAEHWYLRLPMPQLDGWELSLAGGRRIPPPAAVSYLVRFHRTTPVMRLDMDRAFWQEHVRGQTQGDTCANERRVFADLDYAGHDQRCYGYPYPIKAAHDRASLTKPERAALRKQIIDAAVRAGMRRSLFREASLATGHE